MTGNRHELQMWHDAPMDGAPCPACDRPFAVVWRVTIGEPKDGYRPAVPPGTRDMARCETCDLQYERAVDGRWGPRAT